MQTINAKRRTPMQEAIDYLKSFNLEASATIIEEKFLEKEKKEYLNTFHRGINVGALNPKLDIEGRKQASLDYYEMSFQKTSNI